MSAAPHPAVAASLETWHHMVASGHFDDLPGLLNANALFRSPMAFKPYHSAEAVALVLRTAFSVFRNFAYHRSLYSDDGLSVVLEFSAEVGGKELKGIDLIRFDERGRIDEFEVMVRPMSGLQALGEAMGRRIADRLPAYKTPQSPSPLEPG